MLNFFANFVQVKVCFEVLAPKTNDLTHSCGENTPSLRHYELWRDSRALVVGHYWQKSETLINAQTFLFWTV